MIFFKSKEVILDCFTYVPYVYDWAKIDYASKFVPDWWKDTPRTVQNGELISIKSCQGFIDYYKKGIVIPSWFEMDLEIYEQSDPRIYNWRSSSADVATDQSHAPEQFYGFAGTQGKNLKLTSPWAFKTKEDISFAWSQPTWNLRNLVENLTVLPAVVNYKYQHATEVNFFITNKKETVLINIPPLTPLVMLHPLTEKKIKIKNHLVDQNEYKRIFGLYQLFLKNPLDDQRLYSKKKKLQDDVENKLSTCPFKK